MLERTNHPFIPCRLEAADVPAMAESVQAYEDEPFGGLPTLAYARVFEQARSEGVIVLLDGHGIDEQWAGYDYYAGNDGAKPGVVQGSKDSAIRPDCLTTEFRAKAGNFTLPDVFPDRLRNLQYRDARFTKIPRALRFNDRISMRSSTELREPFLDHRLFELALRQPRDRKIANGTGKWLLRQMTRNLLPTSVAEAPKRPMQTPQREWLRGPLREWANSQIEDAVSAYGGSWLDKQAVRSNWQNFLAGQGDNSFFVWQWVSLGLMANQEAVAGA
jgi:asparagine synthase (glutamine-hydrolysing)